MSNYPAFQRQNQQRIGGAHRSWEFRRNPKRL